MAESIKLILITGFLGTGKTTFLKRILNQYQEERLGIIVNEFGQVAIDGLLVQKSGIELKELSNGSIFCACIKDNFLKSLIQLSMQPITTLFIEASGLADPSNMIQILKSIWNKTERKYDYIGSICIIDGESFLDYYELLPALHQQIAYSGAVIVNKIDLVDDKMLTDVLDKIVSINPEATIFVSCHCEVDIYKLIEELKFIEKPSQETSNTPESRPKTFVLDSVSPISHEELYDFLTDISHAVYRIKGFAKTGSGYAYISGVKNHIEITPWDKSEEETRIVIISSVGIKLVSILAERLKGDLKEKLILL